MSQLSFSSFDVSLMVRDAQGRYLLATVRGGLGLPIERDLSFRAEKRLSAYARDARLAGRVVV